MKNISLFGPLMAIILPVLLFGLFTLGFIPDHLIRVPTEHFYIVSTVAILAAMIALAIGVVGYRHRNIKITFLSMSFFSLSQMFSVHGLSTPKFIMGMSHLPGVAAQLGLFLAAIWLWFSSFPSDHKLVKFFSKHHLLLVPFWVVILSIFSILSMSFPHVVDFIPITAKPLNGLFTIINSLLNVMIMFRYYQSYRYSRFPLQLAIVYSSGWLLVSQLIMVLGEIWRLSWWIYHFLLLLSMVVMVIGLVKQFVIKGSFGGALRALFTNDPFERVTNSISPSVKNLVIATEKKDSYTAGHTFRVTMYALKLAEELQLNPETLRVIAQGTLLHDVGKIKIADSILNKPGKLTFEERLVIETHPVLGYEMCRDLGFMAEELSIIRSHHEKWDGTGYPDKLQGESIPKLARIVAVADVYDALTSDRAYRKAWTHEEAMSFLHEQKGIHFDPKFVDAWDELCKRDSSVYLYPAQTIKDETTEALISNF